ncbi:amino acid permease-domain-containing protein [Trichophaea hybrida]|nr:amino acid permease-domain-containing protein [Trichophaea hybrida]
MEGLSEMIGLWPIPNAMVEFVRAFVDYELGTVVGITYWYTYGAGFHTLVLAVLRLAVGQWGISTPSQIAIHVLCPIGLMMINLLGVNLYGFTEVIGALVKLAIVFIAFVLSLALVCGDGQATPIFGHFIGMGPKNDPSLAHNAGVAFCIAVPIVAFAFVGIETVAVTAFEARDPHNSIKKPAKYIAYFTWLIYMACVCAFAAAVSWDDPNLYRPYNESTMTNTTNATTTLDRRGVKSNGSDSVLIIALEKHPGLGLKALPGAMTVCLIIVVLSTANTALYVSSRTLYGLTSRIEPDERSWLMRFFAKFARTTEPNGSFGSNVPIWAILASAVLFAWVHVLRVGGSGESIQTVQEITTATGSVGCVLVWASQCLAFISFRSQMRKHGRYLGPDQLQYDLWRTGNKSIPYTSLLHYFQPLLAYLGFVACVGIGIGLGSVSFWNSKVTLKKWLAAYFGPIAMFVLFVVLKFIRWIRFGRASAPAAGQEHTAFIKKLDDLTTLGVESSPSAST